MTGRPAFVLLEDGTWYPGTTPAPIAPGFGEVVFTTGLSGYQETFTDPSFLGQIVVMTAPMIGNYGINEEDMESPRPQVAGVVVRELAKRASNWRATKGLGEWLGEHQIPIIEGVDTRKLTRHLRSRGAMRGVIAEGTERARGGEITRRHGGAEGARRTWFSGQYGSRSHVERGRHLDSPTVAHRAGAATRNCVARRKKRLPRDVNWLLMNADGRKTRRSRQRPSVRIHPTYHRRL